MLNWKKDISVSLFLCLSVFCLSVCLSVSLSLSVSDSLSLSHKHKYTDSFQKECVEHTFLEYTGLYDNNKLLVHPCYSLQRIHLIQVISPRYPDNLTISPKPVFYPKEEKFSCTKPAWLHIAVCQEIVRADRLSSPVISALALCQSSSSCYYE